MTNIADLRTRATAYFSGFMEQAAATFRARARSFVIILSLFITLLFGTDTIQLAQTFPETNFSEPTPSVQCNASLILAENT